MKWFKHMTNMRHDVRIRRIIKKYGLKGYGLYNTILESITESLTTENPIPDLEENAQDIAEYYGEDTVEINEIMCFMFSQGLFKQDEMTARLICDKIYKFIEKNQTKSIEMRQMIDKYNDSYSSSQTILESSDRREQKRTEQNRTEESKGKKFKKPSKQEIKEFCSENDISIDIDHFVDHYESVGWKIGNKSMKDWKATVRNWYRRQNKFEKEKPELFWSRSSFLESLSDSDFEKLSNNKIKEITNGN